MTQGMKVLAETKTDIAFWHSCEVQSHDDQMNFLAEMFKILLLRNVAEDCNGAHPIHVAQRASAAG